VSFAGAFVPGGPQAGLGHTFPIPAYAELTIYVKRNIAGVVWTTVRKMLSKRQFDQAN